MGATSLPAWSALTWGFTASQAVELEKRLAPRQRSRPVTPCPHRACWVEPELYCRVQSQGWTNHGRLRHAVFRGLLECSTTNPIAFDLNAIRTKKGLLAFRPTILRRKRPSKTRPF